LGDRLRPFVRYVMCPFEPLIHAIPKEGAILDVGCGDGLFLSLLHADQDARERVLVGIDPAKNKIDNAKQLDAKSIEFLCAEIGSMKSDSVDCISIIDVLYLLPLDRWRDFLQHCVRCLKPNGRLIVKEVHDLPRWKRQIAYVQELFSIYVSGMTKGDHPHFESIATYREYLERAGTIVERVQPLDAGFLHAHVMFLARKS
jgi:2-polyprenyl-3-methyl-5-hydroxy-6-metoxy-1,4-benzoquinol methylase